MPRPSLKGQFSQLGFWRGAGGKRDTRPAPPDSGHRRVGFFTPSPGGKTIQTDNPNRCRVIGFIPLPLSAVDKGIRSR